MITNCAFDHDEEQDFTRDFTASIDQDYITLFIYNKGQDFDKETAGKKASRAVVELFPYNFADKPKHRTYQTDSRKNIILKLEYSPVKRVPSEQRYQTTNRFTMLRLSEGPSIPDTLVTHEPVANGEYSDVVGEFKGSGINRLREEDMCTLTHKIEEMLLKEALGNKDSLQWATEKMERNKMLLTERAEKERTDTPKEI
jgi:hypothetical protein